MVNFKFSAGPWNVNEGEDVFGPKVRDLIQLEEKVKKFSEIGINGVQFHDDDAVPDIDNLSDSEIKQKASEVRTLLEKYGMQAEFVAPRLWFDEHTIDGGFTSNSDKDREYAIWRAHKSVDIAEILGCDKIVLWLAREGTVCFESKDPVNGVNKLVESINKILNYKDRIRVLIEPKPNEPIDRSFCPTMGHVMGLSFKTDDPLRVGGLLESAHAILAGLDPANEMAFALYFDKLWGVHLNDQNGIKFDQDKTFGAENLRQAFNQIKVLVENNYGSKGEYIGLDVRPMRTQKIEDCYRHLENSIKMVRILEEKVKKFDSNFQKKCIQERNYEKLEMYVLELLLGNN